MRFTSGLSAASCTTSATLRGVVPSSASMASVLPRLAAWRSARRTSGESAGPPERASSARISGSSRGPGRAVGVGQPDPQAVRQLAEQPFETGQLRLQRGPHLGHRAIAEAELPHPELALDLYGA